MWPNLPIEDRLGTWEELYFELFSVDTLVGFSLLRTIMFGKAYLEESIKYMYENCYKT